MAGAGSGVLRRVDGGGWAQGQLRAGQGVLVGWAGRSTGLGCIYKLRGRRGWEAGLQRWLKSPPDKKHLMAFNSEAQRRPFTPPPAPRCLGEGRGFGQPPARWGGWELLTSFHLPPLPPPPPPGWPRLQEGDGPLPPQYQRGGLVLWGAGSSSFSRWARQPALCVCTALGDRCVHLRESPLQVGDVGIAAPRTGQPGQVERLLRPACPAG